MKKILAVVLLACLMAAPLLAQESAVDREWDYLEQAGIYAGDKDPRALDWGRLRWMYRNTSFYYNAGSEKTREIMGEAAGKIRAGSGNVEVVAYKTLLRRHFAAFQAHLDALALAQRKGGEFIDAHYHAAALEGILDSIAAGGDGASPATAFAVIDRAEEEFMLRHRLNARAEESREVSRNGRTYDLVTYKDPGTGGEKQVYFNIDMALGRAPE